MAIFRRKTTPAGGDDSGVDFGPIGSVVNAALDGTLPVAAACERAAELGGSGSVTPRQLDALSYQGFRQSMVQPGQAWIRARILYAGADAAWTRSHDAGLGHSLVGICADLVQAAGGGLARAGDIRLFATARSVADRGIAVADELGMRAEKGVILQRLGSVFLTCYVAGRTDGNYAAEFRHWVRKALSVGDPDLNAIVQAAAGDQETGDQETGDDEAGDQGAGAAANRWPSHLEAMDLAERYLREALPLVGRERRGMVLKGIADVLTWGPVVGGTADRDELIRVCKQALKALPASNVLDRLSVSRMLAQASGAAGPPVPGSQGPGGARLDRESARQIARLENDWPAYLAETTPLRAWDAVTQGAAQLAAIDPARALRLLARHQEVASLWADDSRRVEHWRLEVRFFGYSYITGAVLRLWESEEQFAATAPEVLAQAVLEPAPLARPDLACALAHVMMASSKFDRGDVGLRALAELRRLGGPDFDAHAQAFSDFGAALQINEGGRLEYLGEADAAIGMFLDAATAYLSMGSGTALVSSLSYISETIGKGRNLTGLSDVSTWLGRHALRAEVLNPEAGPPALQQLADLTLAYQARRRTPADEMCLLMTAVSGRRFGSLLASTTTGYVPDPGVARLLAEVAAAERGLPAGRPLLGGPDWEDALDRDLLVTAYAGEFETSPASTADDDIVNHQRAAERRIMAQLAALGDATVEPVPLAAVRQALDSRTAVLLVREGRWADGQLSTYCLLVTDTESFPSATAGEIPWAITRLSADGRVIQVPPSGLYVAEVRRVVKEEPAPRAVTRRGEQLLGDAASRYARPVLDKLAELRAAGRDRLLVVPHGASHFLPLHLAGRSGRTLADDWTVTYLASLAQLSAPRDHGPRRDGAAVFALGYDDQPGLPTLPSSAAEADAIGGILGVAPVLDGAATERAFTHALESRRYVHLRAHGRHNVDAPLFQTVFLAPGDGGDGQLRAHEVLGLDLRGLELVTLGACETALGRIDVSDNLRGLPAALLLAGASAVIGTLWEVSADASTTFFTRLYERLRANDNDLIGAFGSAQRATRSVHREYRDWGAFYLTGGYNGSGDPHDDA